MPRGAKKENNLRLMYYRFLLTEYLLPKLFVPSLADFNCCIKKEIRNPKYAIKSFSPGYMSHWII